MKVKMYSLRDQQLGIYHAPMFLLSETIAIRTLYMAMADKNSQLVHFSENFALYELGEFDDQSGIVSMLETPKMIVSAKTILEKINFQKSELPLNPEEVSNA